MQNEKPKINYLMLWLSLLWSIPITLFTYYLQLNLEFTKNIIIYLVNNPSLLIFGLGAIILVSLTILFSILFLYLGMKSVSRKISMVEKQDRVSFCTHVVLFVILGLFLITVADRLITDRPITNEKILGIVFSGLVLQSLLYIVPDYFKPKS